MFNEGRVHIFIVEDNEIYSMMLDYILSKDSVYKFTSFKSGEDCVRNLRQNPDVVILDYALPGMNGYETLLEIKKYNPHIHVLMLTNNKDMDLARKILNAGADDYILKQGHGEKQIIEKVESLLERDSVKYKERLRSETKLFFKRLAYCVAIGSLVAAGLIYFT